MLGLIFLALYYALVLSVTVTLDDGRTLDLSDDAPGVRGMRGRSGVKGSGSSFPADNGRPVEAEFRDKR